MKKLAGIRSLILDMDGVLWRDTDAIGDLPGIFAQILNAGLKVVMATNNASRTPLQHLQKLAAFGVPNLEPWQVVSSIDATVAYLLRKYPQGSSVYVVGEPPLSEALSEAGFVNSPVDAGAVVAAIDRDLTYKKLSQAALLIRAGAEFIGTNPDKSFPTPEGLVPGAGAILAALESACDVSPVILGKPSPAMYKLAMQRLGTLPVETLVVGDRPETDMAGAQTIGCRTALVLSGVTTTDQAFRWQPKPDIIAKDLSAVLEILTS
jgi:4-nitrophenyl phosphatase